MLASLIASTVLTYSFPAGSKAVYDLHVTMDGYVPLLGRSQSNVEVKLAIEVAGTGATPAGAHGATYDLVDMKASMSGVPLPFTVDNVKAYFPKATLSISPTGRVLKTDVPDIELPVRLPGLDPKRIPEISFLPIELPESAVQPDSAWTFKRNIGGSDANYTVTPRTVDAESAKLDVQLVQTSTAFEDSTGNAVKTEAEAAAKVETRFTGSGSVVFDRKKGLARLFQAESEAVSTVTLLNTGAKSERRVKSKIRSELRAAGATTQQLSKTTSRSLLGWELPAVFSGLVDRTQATPSLLLRSLGWGR